MDKKVLALVFLAVIASGCADSPEEKPGSVVIQEFSISDRTLNPGQKARVKIKIRNFNDAPTSIYASNISIFNTGQLKVEKGSKSCNPDRIGRAEKGLKPAILCTWTVEAPGKEFVKGFSSKPLSISMRARYSSTLENQEAIKIRFKEMRDIHQTTRFKRKVSNSDLTLTIEGETPNPVSTPMITGIEARNTGPGRILGNLSFEYSPQDIFTDECPETKSLIQGETRFSCPVKASSTGTQNAFIAIHYKYQRTKTLGVEVVNNQ